MKSIKLLALAGCATFLFVSCDPSVGAKRQLDYNQATLVDSEGYAFFQEVGSRAVYENDYANYVLEQGSSDANKQLAQKVKDFYEGLLPELEELAFSFQVNFPISGAAQFSTDEFATTREVETLEVDSLGEEVVVTNTVVEEGFSDEGYQEHVRAEAEAVVKQFQRIERSTSKTLRSYARENIEQAESLLVAAGGEVPHAGH